MLIHFHRIFFLHFLAAVVISLFLQSVLFSEWFHNVISRRSSRNLLLVGILSARGNFQMRDVIRQTWLQHLHTNSELYDRVSYRFIVGDKDCDIHPKNRKSSFSCERNILTIPDCIGLPVITAMEGPTVDPNGNQIRMESFFHWNISLTIHHPIVVRQLGLHLSVNLHDKPIKLVLFDERREADIATARFSLADPGMRKNWYRYQTIEAVILPRDFIGSLHVILDNTNSRLNLTDLNFLKTDFFGLVEVDYLDGLEIRNRPGNNSVILSTFIASVFDEDSLRNAVKGQDQLDQDHQSHMTSVELEIQKEKEKYEDLLFLNVYDVYRNLPAKLLKFHQWVKSSMLVDFILKTDDDCYIDLDKIVTRLEDFQGQKKIWWSNFRENWVVERFGKWEERSYRSYVYPPFACGSGNIVSSDVSDWIAKNANDLFSYQGEDVSMGIWLSAISVNFRFDQSWKCDKNCDDTALVIPELNPDELKQFWNNKNTCGNPCGCLQDTSHDLDISSLK